MDTRTITVTVELTVPADYIERRGKGLICIETEKAIENNTCFTAYVKINEED